MFTVTLAGCSESFPCAEDDTITRAGLRAGYALPYECNTGSCGTCKVEVVEGDVRLLRTDPPGLTDRDRAKRRTLGCQATPTTNCVVKARWEPLAPEIPRPERYAARLIATREVTHDIREFTFESDRPAWFLPGQYALLHFADGLTRPYSMSNLPGDGHWQFCIRHVAGGQATPRLFDARPGGLRLALDGPFGNAFLRRESSRDIVCIAGGSGLSPVLSIARAVAADEALQERHVYFFYGGREPRDLCGEDVLMALPELRGRCWYVPVVSNPADAGAVAWTGRTGYVHAAVAEALPGLLPDYEFYFAGPPAMAVAVQRMLLDAKVPLAQMHFDQFY